MATLNSGTPTYHHRDHLSTRVETNTSGSAVRTFGHFPFGESWHESGTATKWKFTSYERDSESGVAGRVARMSDGLAHGGAPHKLVSLVWGFGAVREKRTILPPRTGKKSAKSASNVSFAALRVGHPPLLPCQRKGCVEAESQASKPGSS